MVLCVSRKFDQKNRLFIPKEFIEKAGWKLDGECYVSLDEDDRKIVIEMKKERNVEKKPAVKKYCVRLEPSGQYLQDGFGEISIFSTKESAEDALRNEMKELGIEEGKVIENVGFCFRCGSPLFPSDIAGYKTQCFACDEDFYGFEQSGTGGLCK